MRTEKNPTIRQPRGIVPPALFGRVFRILLGAYQIWFVSFMLSNFNELVYSKPNASPDWLSYFLGILIAYRWLHVVINLGFSVRWGRRVRQVYLVAILAAMALDLFLYGSLWGPPLGGLLILLGLYLHTHLGIAHILSGLLATPGCEMRSYAHLATIVMGHEITDAAICPGMWTPFDRWEQQLAASSGK